MRGSQTKDGYHLGQIPQASHNDEVIIRQADRLENNRIILFKKAKQLAQGKYYVVEISTNPARSLFIAAFDMESPESLLIELRESKSQQILSQFDNDYELISNSLQVL